MGIFNRQGATPKFVALLRLDPCSYCGRLPMVASAGTIDHIRPRLWRQGPRILPDTGFSRDHWTNLTAACRECNHKRKALSILRFLLYTNRPKLKKAA